MKEFSVKHANQLGQDKKYDELYAYVKSYIKENCEDTAADPLVFYGLCYDFGYGVEKDNDYAVVLYKHASDKGSLIGMFHYAYALRGGYGVEEDKEKAKSLLEKIPLKKRVPEITFYLALLSDEDTKLNLLKQAAKQKYIPAIVELGRIYKEKDINQSIGWLKKACSLNSYEAKFELAKNYYNKKEYEGYLDLLLEIVTGNPDLATRAYHEKFCYLNSCRKIHYSYDNYFYEAFEELGDFVLYSWKCEEEVVDYDRAKLWYEAALTGCTSEVKEFYLLLKLCRAYRWSSGFEGCAKSVVDLYFRCLDIVNKNKDCEFRCADPFFYIGLAYLNGLGVSKNSSEAVKYFHKAISAIGDNDNEIYSLCKYYLGLCYYFGDGVQQDVNKAIEYWSLKSSFNLYDNPSQIALAYLYEQGIGVEMDLDNANKLYKKYLTYSYMTIEGVSNFISEESGMLGNLRIRDLLLKIDKINAMKNKHNELVTELERLKQECYKLAVFLENTAMMSDANVHKVKALNVKLTDK